MLALDTAADGEIAPHALIEAVSAMREAVMVLEGKPGFGHPRVTYVNVAFSRMTGYSLAEVVGRTPLVLLGRQSDPATIRHAERRIMRREACEGRIIAYRSGGEPFLLDWYVEPMRSRGGCSLAVLRDVTHEDPRDATMRHMITALDNVQEAIVVLSASREVQYLNRAAAAMFDGDREPEIPLPNAAWMQLEHGRAWKGSLAVQVRGDERKLQVYAKPLQGFDGERSHLVVLHDVTDVQRLQSIADSVNFSDNLGHFLSGIRHELGNPVNSIKTALTVLRANLDGFSPEKVHDYLDRVLGEVSRIEYLLHWLRSFSVNEVVELGRVELADLLHELVALVEPSAQRAGVTLQVVPPPRVAVVADARALYQVLINLVSNAIEALPGTAGPILRIETELDDDRVHIAVVDNGPGMSAENLALAMRPFFTTKRTGTGLGLVIAQRLLANQGGLLQLRSEPGAGTRALVSLQRASEQREGDTA